MQIALVLSHRHYNLLPALRLRKSFSRQVPFIRERTGQNACSSVTVTTRGRRPRLVRLKILLLALLVTAQTACLMALLVTAQPAGRRKNAFTLRRWTVQLRHRL